jgi:uncharacterized lipoprotein YddW (UPF0748 family)
MSKFYKGVWAHSPASLGKTPEAIRKAIARLADGGFDLLIPCVKQVSGLVDYHSKVARVKPEYDDWDPLAVIAEEAKATGIKVHPWFCVFTEGKHSVLMEQNPELRAMDREGNPAMQGKNLYWTCTARPEVQDYEFALYEEVMNNYDVAGVHLDYIRAGAKGFCSCEFCHEAGGVKKPLTELTPKDDEWSGWIDWRADNITRFVKRVHDAAAERQMEVSAAVFPQYPECIVDDAQNWALWAEMGLIDFMFPMNYTNSTEMAARRTVNHVASVKGHCPVWEGLGKRSADSTTSTQTLIDQTKSVLKEGAQGIVIFSYPAVTDEDMNALEALGI